MNKFFSRSHRAVIRVYDATSNLIEMRGHTGDFNEASMKDVDQAAARSKKRLIVNYNYGWLLMQLALRQFLEIVF